MEVLYQHDRKPPSFCADVLRKFGQNQYGENLYRVVWSESQFELIGGIWHERLNQGESGHIVQTGNFVHESNPTVLENACYKRVPKIEYDGLPPTYVIEKWVACSYTQEEWYRKFTDPISGLCTLGPYPERGTWQFCFAIGVQDRMIYPTAAVIEYYARLCEAGKQYSKTENDAAVMERHLKKKREWSQRFDDIFDDAQAAGGTTNLFFSTTGPKSKDRQKVEDVPIIDVRPMAEAMGLPTTPGFSQGQFKLQGE